VGRPGQRYRVRARWISIRFTTQAAARKREQSTTRRVFSARRRSVPKPSIQVCAPSTIQRVPLYSGADTYQHVIAPPSSPQPCPGYNAVAATIPLSVVSPGSVPDVSKPVNVGYSRDASW
jgi:hypothetical protein